jgi:hypothetical protein
MGGLRMPLPLTLRLDCHILAARRSTSASSRQSHLSNSLRNNPPFQRSHSTNNIMLRISPAASSATFGYIYLTETELHNEDAITAYFDSAGWAVNVFPCPDFKIFIAKNVLMYCNVMFITDLPRCIIPAGIQILKANNYNASPQYNWLPEPPNLLSFQPSSRSTGTSKASSQRSHSHSLLSHQDSYVGLRPDPEGIDSHPSHHYNPCAPVQTILMGGNPAGHSGSHGGMSPLTHRGSGSVGGGVLVVGLHSRGAWGTHPRSHLTSSASPPPDPQIQSLSLLHNPTPDQLFPSLATCL